MENLLLSVESYVNVSKDGISIVLNWFAKPAV